MTTVRVRIAPSPTGPLHIGTARTALFNYLFARQHGGIFVLRLEDTDQARSSEVFARDILDTLRWLGLLWDEGPTPDGLGEMGPFGPYRQMRRLHLYREVADGLVARDLAYPCYCTPAELEAERRRQEAAGEPPHYPGRCAHLTSQERRDLEAAGRRPAIRFRIGTGRVVFDDLVRGRVEIDSRALGGDLVIVRSDGTPLYHFTVVVDDALMAISHVIRGEDHLSNTPKHILLFRALDAPVPVFAHLPLILNPDRSKMSKRKSQTAIAEYRAEGFLPEALVNFLALLGWSSGSEEEVFSLNELVERFDLAGVQRAGAVFDRGRLEWLNGVWIRRLPPADLVERLLPFFARARDEGRIERVPSPDELAALLPVLQERLPTLASAVDLVGFLYVDEIAVDPAVVVPRRWDPATTRRALELARERLAAVGAVSWEADELEPPLRALAEEEGWKAGDLFMAIRVATTGQSVAPPLFDTLVALGPERTLRRLDRTIAGLAGLGASPASASPL